MQDVFEANNVVDENGNPSGGSVAGAGLAISWQSGPLGRGADRLPPNGAFVETVIASCIQRIQFYETAQNGKFHCMENQNALWCLRQALEWLERRTAVREQREVEGTHEV